MDLFAKLTHDTTLLTPNRRLSLSLLKKHQQWQIKQNKSTWQSPDILPFSNWLDRFWREACAKNKTATPLLLSPQQEQVIWENILRLSPQENVLLQLSKTSELAKSAWGLLKEWQVDLQHSSFQTTEDHLVFQEWAKQFKKLCTQQHWIDVHSMTQKLCEKIKSADIKLPEKIILMGFTELSPLQQQLLNFCKINGSQIIEHKIIHENQSIQRISLLDEETEILTMARWSKSLLTNNPSAFIGCIIPNLEDKRDQIIQIFSRVFSEENTYTLNYTELPFNISAGKCLSTYPVIHTALQLLSLHTRTISLTTLSDILRSPFLGKAESERLQRAQFENRLRQLNIASVTLKELLEDENTFNFAQRCPALYKQLHTFYVALTHTEKKQPISQWVTLFISLLNELGWPGERDLNSFEFQTIYNCWLPLLTEYATYDAILGEQTYATALHFLTRLTATTVFQPQSPEAPIQILGMLEAVDLPFDHLWISGLDDAAWPSPAKPNPFIPLRLQKTLNMPNASPERELLYCRKLTEQLKQSAQHVIFSHALQDDHVELRPSTLIKNINEINFHDLILSEYTPPTQHLFKTQQLEFFVDEKAPTISASEKIRGGAHIFKLQAACPFKAFAEIRLHADQMETLSLGLKPQDRGNVVHKALEIIWQTLHSSMELNKKTDHELHLIIHHAAKNAIASLKKQNNKRYLALEIKRLQKIIFEWLQLEKARPPFTVISREEERTVNIGPIHVKLRVDRIDELENGEQFIIDYKTGKNNHIKSWFDDRLDEPQLPLYCVINSANMVGISFAEIHADKIKMSGISQSDLFIQGVMPLTSVKYSHTTSWQDQILKWQTQLEKLGDEFYQGNATVDPKNKNETCQHCPLTTLCRIHEMEEKI